MKMQPAVKSQKRKMLAVLVVVGILDSKPIKDVDTGLKLDDDELQGDVGEGFKMICPRLKLKLFRLQFDNKSYWHLLCVSCSRRSTTWLGLICPAIS